MRSGTISFVVPDLDATSANESILSILQEGIDVENILIIAGHGGSMKYKFCELGAVVKIVEDAVKALQNVHDVFLVFCSTILTADVVIELTKTDRHPVLWSVCDGSDAANSLNPLRTDSETSRAYLPSKTELHKALSKASVILFPSEQDKERISAFACVDSNESSVFRVVDPKQDPILLNKMFKKMIYEIAPPVLLVDMDGVLVDWDAGFRSQWERYYRMFPDVHGDEHQIGEEQKECTDDTDNRPSNNDGVNVNVNVNDLNSSSHHTTQSRNQSQSQSQSRTRCPPIFRSRSYEMIECVPQAENYRRVAAEIYHERYFFFNLPPMPGALKAMREMQQEGIQVMICTSPVITSVFSAEEKSSWVSHHLGPEWLDRLIITCSKTAMRGDYLLDDKPLDLNPPSSQHTATSWKQILFQQPYNVKSSPRIKRMRDWGEWRSVIMPLLKPE